MNISFTPKALITLLCCSFMLTASAQTWQRLSAASPDPSVKGSFASYHTDRLAFHTLMSRIPQENNALKPAPLRLVLPAPDGHMTDFFLEETQLLHQTDGAPKVQVHTYSGYSEDKSELIHLSTYKDKVYGVVLRGGYTWYISTPDGVPVEEHLATIDVFDDAGRSDAQAPLAVCSMGDDITRQLTEEATGQKPTLTPSTGYSLRIYRLAVASTGQFTNASGSQANAIANLTALVNNVNAIYERDMGIRFTMVTNNNLIYTDSTTDPFDPTQGPCNQLAASQTSFSSNLNSADYDLGITIFYTNFGGCAGGRACSANKGRATSGFNSINPTSYLREVTSHEICHQLSGGHTHNSNAAGCNFAAPTAWELGGGSTIMAYSGCPPAFTSYNTTIYFHGGSIGQMKAFTSSTAGSCYTTGAVNTTPAITTPSDDTFFIPVSTPYRLYADATDAEDNNLLYSFEQMDLGTGDSVLATPATATGPIVRSFQPASRPYRYIPRMDSLRANIYPAFEVLSSVPRLLTFWATVRDNHPGGGSTSVDTFLIRTTGTAPFQVSSQNTPLTLSGGSAAIVTWDVAATDQAPVNTQSVKILFAADGLNYDYILQDSVPNNGSAAITVPNINTQNGRIMVAARGNIFFDINNADIIIQPSCSTAQQSGIWPGDPVNALQGAAALQLDLLPIYGEGVDTFAGEITATDPTGIIGFRNSPTDSTCRAGSGYSGRYDLYRFRVAQPGTYTIGRTLYTLPANPYMTIYGSGGLTATAAGACDNYAYGSTTYFSSPTSGTTSTNSSFTFSGIRDSVYTLAVMRRGTTNLGTYRVNISGPAQVYPELQTPAGNYAFLVIDSAGTIIDISATSPNLQSQAPGSYTVYGVSYSPSLNLNTYLNQPFANLVSASFGPNECAAISTNKVQVNISPNNPLPNDYIRLTAHQEQQAARLDWQTGSTAGITGFQLEQSSDGRRFSLFRTLGKDEAKQQEGRYSYRHTGVMPGNNYYRVKANGIDGESRYSNIAVLNFSGQPGLTIVPNPTTNQVSIQVKGYTLPLHVRLTDMSGRVLQQHLIDRDGYTFSVAGLAPGLYLLSGKGFAVKLSKR